MLPAPSLFGTAENEPRSAPPRHGADWAGAPSALPPATSMSSMAPSAIRTALRYPPGPQAREPVDLRERREDPLPYECEPHRERAPDHDRRHRPDQRRRRPGLERAQLVGAADEDHLDGVDAT